jgi:hypothetical protein
MLLYLSVLTNACLAVLALAMYLAKSNNFLICSEPYEERHTQRKKLRTDQKK